MPYINQSYTCKVLSIQVPPQAERRGAGHRDSDTSSSGERRDGCGGSGEGDKVSSLTGPF